MLDRFDYDPQTRVLIFRMPTSIHEIFTDQVIDEIKRQLQDLRKDASRPDVVTLASSIICCASTNIFLLGDMRNKSCARSEEKEKRLN